MRMLYNRPCKMRFAVNFIVNNIIIIGEKL
nr:MAG TPA: hypothetical protein [Caudoviricetes sp.]